MHFFVVAESFLSSSSPVELTVSQNSLTLSGEGFTVSDPHGSLLFKMDGHALSLRDRCTLLDRDGNPILTARKKLRSLHERWEVARGGHFSDDLLLFSVKKSSVVQFKTHLKVFLPQNHDDDDPDFEVKGNFFEREAQIYQRGQLIAEVKRKFSVGNVLLDKHTFAVVMHPHVDQAFIATLVIIMDRIHED